MPDIITLICKMAIATWKISTTGNSRFHSN